MKKLTFALLVALAALATGCQDSVFSMEVGDCFNDPDGVEVSRVEGTDCTEPHDNEVYLLFDIPGDGYPGESVVTEQAQDGCLNGFDSFVGMDYWDSELEIGYFTPSEGSWSDGDREVVCYLFELDGSQLTATARNAAR